MLPGVGAFPAAMSILRELDLEEPLRACAADGQPFFGFCMGMQLLFESSEEHGGATGLGHPARRGPPAGRRRAQPPPHRLERGALDAPVAAHRGPARPDRLLPRALVRPTPGRRARTCSARASTGRRSPRSSRATTCSARSSTREVVGERPRAAAQLHADLRAGVGVILYPAIDIRERQGRAPRPGPLRRRRRSTTRTRSTPRARGSSRARASCTSSTSTARAPARRRTSSTCERITSELERARSSSAAGCAAWPSVRDALRAGADRVILGTAAYTDVDFLDEVLGAFETARRRLRRRARRARRGRGLDRDDPDAGRRRHRAASRPAACASFVYSSIERDGMLAGRRPRRGPPRRRHACAGRFLYSGGVGTLDDLQRARGRCARSTSPA